jgi:lysophospholipase L1-like esterase
MINPLCFNPTLLSALLIILLGNRLSLQRTSYHFTYCALGDSIAYGLGTPNRYGYVYQYRDYLRLKYPNIKLINCSRTGITSSGLLSQLMYSSKVRYSIKSAQIITISIGGNNLLRSGSQNYSILNPDIAQAGIKKFERDWPLILSHIRSNIGSNATILVMTLYNPYKYDDLQYPAANYFIQQINYIIKNPSLEQTFGYFTVDTYEHFEKNIDKNWTHFTKPRRNPHPNAEGHRQIALLHKSLSGV